MSARGFREWFEARGLRQADACAVLAAAPAEVARWWHGRRDVPPRVVRIIELVEYVEHATTIRMGPLRRCRLCGHTWTSDARVLKHHDYFAASGCAAPRGVERPAATRCRCAYFERQEGEDR